MSRPCPLCVRPPEWDVPRRGAVDVGDPADYCTVNAHRELAEAAAGLATWNDLVRTEKETP